MSGEETFKVKAHKIKIQEFHLRGRAARCKSGESIDLVATGDGMQHVYLGVTGAMLRVAAGAEGGGSYETGHLGNTDDSTAVLEIKCGKPGTFRVTRQWFGDRRLSITHKIAAGAMVRGTATLTVTVEPAFARKR